MIGLPDAADLALDDETWASLAAEERWVDDEHLLNAQRILAQAGRWDGVHVLSVIARLETSVLIDADDKVFIDWGTAAALQPPVGGRLPFKLWVHTHPRFAAYWSGTDVNSLSLGARILEAAMVLGQPGPKVSHNYNMNCVRLRGRNESINQIISIPETRKANQVSTDIVTTGKDILESISESETRLIQDRLNKIPTYRKAIHDIDENETGNINSHSQKKMLSDEGPLSNWTDEEPVPWSEWYTRNNINAEVAE